MCFTACSGEQLQFAIMLPCFKLKELETSFFLFPSGQSDGSAQPLPPVQGNPACSEHASQADHHLNSAMGTAIAEWGVAWGNPTSPK